jgi:hypothetical protein
MSFRSNRFLKTFRTRRELKASTRFAARNGKKTATTLDFPKARAPGDAELNRTRVRKVLSQFDDSHFCNKRLTLDARQIRTPEQINAHLADSQPTQSPRQRMWNNPFIAHQFF